jgi:UrcA family protein
MVPPDRATPPAHARNRAETARIARAADRVCHEQAMHNLNLLKDMRACRRIAITNAKAQRDALFASTKEPGRTVLASR